MKYCSNCGSPIADDAKFCSNCGNQVKQETATFSKRTEEYAGKVIKCPACGTILTSMTGICPGCGHEINSRQLPEALRVFMDDIRTCDKEIANGQSEIGWRVWGKLKKTAWVVLNVVFLCFPLMIAYLVKVFSNPYNSFSSVEKHKASVIENYSFSNDRESILESILFVKDKVSFLMEGKSSDKKNVYWADLWAKKADQLYDKAEILFPQDHIARDAYQEIVTNCNKIKKRYKLQAMIKSIVIVIIFVLFYVYGNSVNEKKSGMKYQWPENEMTSIVPQPNNEYGEITKDYSDAFDFEVYQVTEDDFKDYVQQCINNGFKHNYKKKDASYDASHSDGYVISIEYNDYSQRMSVKVRMEKTK